MFIKIVLALTLGLMLAAGVMILGADKSKAHTDGARAAKSVVAMDPVELVNEAADGAIEELRASEFSTRGECISPDAASSAMSDLYVLYTGEISAPKFRMDAACKPVMLSWSGVLIPAWAFHFRRADSQATTSTISLYFSQGQLVGNRFLDSVRLSGPTDLGTLGLYGIKPMVEALSKSKASTREGR